MKLPEVRSVEPFESRVPPKCSKDVIDAMKVKTKCPYPCAKLLLVCFVTVVSSELFHTSLKYDLKGYLIVVSMSM